MKYYNEISRSISILRYPLALLVVIIHYDVASRNFDGFIDSHYSLDYFFLLCLKQFCKLSVSTFFFISGYLFFVNLSNKFNKNEYISKIFRRTKNLLVPYLFWNTVAIAIILLQGTYQSEATPIHDFIRIYIGKTTYTTVNILGNAIQLITPINGPLWFMRDLFVLSILSPVIWLLSRKNNYYYLILLFFLSIFGPFYLHFIRYSPILFYSLGAFIAINDIDIISIYRSHRNLLLLNFVFWFCISFVVGGEFVKLLFILSFVIIVFGFVEDYNVFLVPLLRLSRYSLVIYCSHIIIALPVANKIASHLFFPLNLLSVLIITTFISIIIFHCLKPINKYFKVV